MAEFILRNVVFKLVVATVAAMSLRLLLTLNDASIVCSAAPTRDVIVTLVFDALTIMTLGAAIGLRYARPAPRQMWLAWLLPAVGCALYIVLRHPCLVGL